MKKEISKRDALDWVKIKDSQVHGKGIFAKKDIQKGTRVIEYIGEKITKAKSDKRAEEVLQESKKNKKRGAVYIFELNKRHDIDGNVSWNPARFINHSCNPNCETDIIQGHIWIISTRDIKKGEEITYNYGYDLENFEEHPCKCGSENCVGYIVDEKHRKKLLKKINK